MLKLLKKIPKKGLYRVSLFCAVLVAAWLFDHFHQETLSSDAGTEVPATPGNNPGYTFFCTQQSLSSLKIPGQRVSHDKQCRERINQLIVQQLSRRAFCISGAEIFTSPRTSPTMRSVSYIIFSFTAGETDLPGLA